MPNDLQLQINRLQAQLELLSAEYHLNNFASSQDVNKYTRYNTRLKVPHYATAPAICEVGEIIEVGGKLKVCSAANTYTTVGTQV